MSPTSYQLLHPAALIGLQTYDILFDNDIFIENYFLIFELQNLLNPLKQILMPDIELDMLTFLTYFLSMQ